MNKNTSHSVSAQATVVRPVTATGRTPDAIRDTGRVRVGGGMLNFIPSKTLDAVKDTGRVRVGGGMLRFF